MTSSPIAIQSRVNPDWLEAMLTTDGSLLIVAWSGSGNTVTLVEQIVQQMRENILVTGQIPGLDRAKKESLNRVVERYRLIETQQFNFPVAAASHASGSRAFSPLSLMTEVTRYLNRSQFETKELLDATKDGADELVAITNEFNELLYDSDESQQIKDHEVALIKLLQNSYCEVSASKEKIIWMHDAHIKYEERAKSFHLDPHCFEAGMENWLFCDLLRKQRRNKIYFTWMLTHIQSDSFVQYIDPYSRTFSNYYPDFIFQCEEPDVSLTYAIGEAKADNSSRMRCSRPIRALSRTWRWPAGWGTTFSIRRMQTNSSPGYFGELGC